MPAEATSAQSGLPTAASFCSDFLKADMQHVYRQVTGVENYRPFIIARKRENAALFPFDESRVHLIHRPHHQFLRRILYRQILGRPIPCSAGEVRSIEGALARSGAELLHVYFGNSACDLIPVLRRHKVPTVISFHGADATAELDRPGFRRAMGEAVELADLVLARSESLMDAVAALGCPREKLRLSRTGLPLDDWPFEARNPPEDGAWRILQTCRIVPKKGAHTTLRAFAKVRESFPKATLTFAGDGPDRANCEALAAELGVAEAVRFTGFLTGDDLRAEVYRAHLFVHPSETDAGGNQEGVPNAMLEAMASGLPTAATYHGGIPEAISDGESGLLVEEGDSGALASGLLRLLGEPDFYSKIAAGGRRAVEEGFSRRAQIASLEQSYRDAVAGSDPAT